MPDVDLTPASGVAEWHLTYRCSLRCNGCSRGAWLRQPHTENMTLADAEEWCRQADAIGWKERHRLRVPSRIVIIGGEPTLHPQFLDFVRLARDWSGVFVQVYSNYYTEHTREELSRAQSSLGASLCDVGAKRQGSVRGPEMYPGWRLDMYVSPADAGLPSPPCYAHPSEICGLCVDHGGYSICCIGGSVRSLLGLPKTLAFADLFDRPTAARMTAEECRHCGFEYGKRPVSHDVRDQFAAYAATCPTIQGCKMSSTWRKVFEGRDVKPELE